MPITESQVDAVAFIEQSYFDKGQLPSDEKISDVVGVTVQTVKSWWNNDQFIGALKMRQVPLPDKDDGLLTLIQLEVITRLLNTSDKRSIREKLKECGVTSNQFSAWMRDPKFSGYYKRRAEELFGAADATAYLSIVKSMESGDLSATKLFLEMRGIYNPKIQVDVNVDSVLVRVVEIVSKHVTDPAILAAIAEDIERIDGVGLRPPPTSEALTPPRDALDVSSTPSPSAPVFEI